MTTNNVVDEKRYVVKRNGIPVSESEFPTKEEALTEYNHWKNILSRWPDGSRLEIVEV